MKTYTLSNEEYSEFVDCFNEQVAITDDDTIVYENDKIFVSVAYYLDVHGYVERETGCHVETGRDYGIKGSQVLVYGNEDENAIEYELSSEDETAISELLTHALEE